MPPPTNAAVDLFAPPTPEEMARIRPANKAPTQDLFAPPTQAEIDSLRIEQRQGVSFSDRLKLKNLIDEDAKLQQEYLRKKGFESRFGSDNQLQVRKPGDAKWSVVDPKGFDIGDLADHFTDLIEAGASGFASGAKIVGAIGAPSTGGASLAAGAGLGGLATGGVETGKQLVAKQMGLREDVNVPRIATKAALGAAIPLGFEAARRGLGKAIGKNLTGIRPDAEEIKAAAKEIGAKATPGMLAEGKTLSQVEDVLVRRRGGIGGSVIRGQTDRNIKAVEETANTLVAGRSGVSGTESGSTFAEQVKKSVADTLRPAEDIYSKVEKTLKDTAAVSLDGIKSTIATLKEEHKFSTEALKFLSRLESRLPTAKTVDTGVLDASGKAITKEVPAVMSLADLKKLRTAINDEVSGQAPKNIRRAANQAYEAVTHARHDSLVRAAQESADPAVQGLKGSLDEADAIYKRAAQQVETALLPRGASIKKGVAREAKERVGNVVESKRVDKFLPAQDPVRAAALKSLSPEGFDTLARQRIEGIAQKATSRAIGGEGKILPSTLVREIDKLEPAVAKEIFGDNAMLKKQALQKFLSNMPARLNPSGTSDAITLMSIVKLQLGSLNASALHTFLQHRGDITKSALYGSVMGAKELQNRAKNKEESK